MNNRNSESDSFAVSHPERAVIILSGGMDSATALAIASSQGHRLALIHFDYGQRNCLKERTAFEALAEHYAVDRKLIIEMDFLKQIGGSALTDENIGIPNEIPAEGEIPSTYVPFRNGIMLSLAAAWAEVIDAAKIYTGFVEEDSSGYPDCREVFVEAMERAVNLGRKTGNAIEIIAPLLHKRKSEIIKIGMQLNVPYESTWSCYYGGDVQCGKCPACRLRRKAFAGAGIPDPVNMME